MTGRPEPVILPNGAGLWVPAELTAELAGALATLEAYQRGTPPPTACTQPRLTRGAAEVLQAAREAAVQHRRRENLRRATLTSAGPTVTVLPPAQPGAPSDLEMVTTRRAADIAGVSQEWVRRLATEGRIRGQRTDRNVWLVNLDDVRAWRNGRTRRTGTHGYENPDPEREAGRGAA